MTDRRCLLSAAPVRGATYETSTPSAGHDLVAAVPGVAPAAVPDRYLASGPHIRGIWSMSARDRPSAATRGSSEGSLREFVNDYSADVTMPFYIVTRSLDEVIEDRLPSADWPLMHGQADKRLTYRHSSGGAVRKARTGRCLAARTGETDQEIPSGLVRQCHICGAMYPRSESNRHWGPF